MKITTDNKAMVLGMISSKVDELAAQAKINVNGYSERPLIERVAFVGLMAGCAGDKAVFNMCESFANIIVGK
jgi:hypothetical protein